MSKNTLSARKGKAIEQLIAATCVLGSGLELNVLTALVDDEGVDLVFKRRDGSRTLDVQVKARFSDEAGSRALRERGSFVADVREETFRPRDDLFMLFAAIDGSRADIERVWLVPSSHLHEKGFRITVRGKRLVRFQASAKDAARDKWRAYRMSRDEFPGEILKAIQTLEVG